MTYSARGWLTALATAALIAVYATAPGTGPWCRNVAAGVRVVYEHRNSSLESRAASLMGEAYLLIARARDTTPPTSRILIPAGPAFDPVSNRLWCAYYLRPRRLVQEKDLTAAPLADQVDYLLVYHGFGLKYLAAPPDSITGAEAAVVGSRRFSAAPVRAGGGPQ